MNYSEFDFTSGPLNRNKCVQQGDLLIAEPFLEGEEFTRSVVLLCEHSDENGSFGLILNKQSELNVPEVVESLHTNQPLYIGGPVEKNTLHFLHTFSTIKNSIKLGDTLFWGGDYDQIKLLDLQGDLNPTNIRFFMGYSGWGKNQLKREIKEESWIISTFNLSQIFTTHSNNLWEETLRKMGGKYRMFSNYPTDPQLN